MITQVEVFTDEQSVVSDSPVLVQVTPASPVVVEVVAATSQVQSTDPATGKPYAVMLVEGRNIIVADSPPPGQYVGDLYFPKP